MALYTTQTISGYNSSPPSDDGSEVASNQGTWDGVKSKLGDPIKTLAEAINTQLVTAFASVAVEKISAGTVSASSPLDITGLTSSYRMYELQFSNLAPATDAVDMWIRLAVSGAFQTGASDYAWANSVDGSGGATANRGSASDSKIILTGTTEAGNGAGETLSGLIRIHDPGNSDRTQVSWAITGINSGSALVHMTGSGQYLTAGATDGFRLQFASGNISTMNYTLLGYIV